MIGIRINQLLKQKSSFGDKSKRDVTDMWLANYLHVDALNFDVPCDCQTVAARACATQSSQTVRIVLQPGCRDTELYITRRDDSSHFLSAASAFLQMPAVMSRLLQTEIYHLLDVSDHVIAAAANDVLARHEAIIAVHLHVLSASELWLRKIK